MHAPGRRGVGSDIARPDLLASQNRVTRRYTGEVTSLSQAGSARAERVGTVLQTPFW